ncbi:MAG: hypothetical protein ACXV5Q_09000 [Frankiaceae bacterium]
MTRMELASSPLLRRCDVILVMLRTGKPPYQPNRCAPPLADAA